MAPSNDYLTDESVQKLAAHNNRLVKRTTIEFPGEAPEVHWDFHRPVEYSTLGGYLERFAEPDFADGKVTLTSAAQQVYGPELDDYLVNRMTGMLKPASGFNKAHPVDGLVYVVDSFGHIKRDNRGMLAERELANRFNIANERVRKTGATQLRGINAALRRAMRINPAGKPELERQFAEQKQLTQSSLWPDE